MNNKNRLAAPPVCICTELSTFLGCRLHLSHLSLISFILAFILQRCPLFCNAHTLIVTSLMRNASANRLLLTILPDLLLVSKPQSHCWWVINSLTAAPWQLVGRSMGFRSLEPSKSILTSNNISSSFLTIMCIVLTCAQSPSSSTQSSASPSEWTLSSSCLNHVTF